MWSLFALGALALDLSPARIDLVSGRADVAQRAGVVSLGAGEGLEVPGSAYVEVGAASELSLRWRQEASIDLRGSAALEWRSPQDSRGVLVTAWRLREADFEVRRGPLRIDVGGWRIELFAGAASVRTLADGRLELRHVAGPPLAVFHDPDASRVSPPWTVLPGAVVRLGVRGRTPVVEGARGPSPAPRPRSIDAPRATRPWSSFAWPWGDAELLRRAGSSPKDVREHDIDAERASPARIESGRIAPAAAPRRDGASLVLPLVGRAMANEGEHSSSNNRSTSTSSVSSPSTSSDDPGLGHAGFGLGPLPARFSPPRR